MTLVCASLTDLQAQLMQRRRRLNGGSCRGSSGRSMALAISSFSRWTRAWGGINTTCCRQFGKPSSTVACSLSGKIKSVYCSGACWKRSRTSTTPRDHFREYHISLRHRSCIPLLRKLIVWPPGGLHRFINQFSNSDSQIVIFYIEQKLVI